MTEAFFHQEWAQLEDALAGTQSRVTLRCKHTVARPVFDALVQCRRRGLQVQLSLPDTALNRQSAIAWERLSAIGGHIAWRQAASEAAVDGSFPALALVLDDAQVFTGKLGTGICAADDASEVPGLVCWSDADFVRQTHRLPDSVAIGSHRLSLPDFAATLAGAEPGGAVVRVRRGRLDQEKRIGSDAAKLYDWIIHPEGFAPEGLMEIARLQAWTLKPARLR